MSKNSSQARAVDKTFAKARQHMDAGDRSTAERLLKQVIAEDAAYAGAYYYLGRIAQSAGYQAHAVPLLQEAVRLEPDNVEYVRYFARHLASIDQVDNALAVLREGLARNPASSELEKLLASMEKGEASAQSVTVEQMHELAAREAYPELQVLSKRALDNDETNLRARHYYGLSLFHTGYLEEAIQQYNLVVHQDPRDDRTWGQLGIAYMDKSMPSASFAAHAKALAINPAESVHHINAGVAYLEFGRIAEADRHAREAISLAGNSVGAIVLLGRVAAKTYQHEKARQLFRKALTIKPDHKPAMIALTEVLLAEGKLQETEWESRRLILMDPDMIGAYNSLVDCLMGQQKSEQALEFALQGVERKPADTSIKNRLGICYLNNKYFSDAIDTYRSILEVKPDFFPSQVNLAGAYSLTGSRDESLHFYEKALESPQAHSEHYSNLVFSRLYDPDVTAAEQLELSIRWAEKYHGDKPRYDAWNVQTEAGAPLRLGIVSGDLRDHPVGYFLESVLNRMSAMGVEIYLYPTVVAPDDTSKRFEKLADKWRLCHKDSPDAIARAIHEDGVNVLLDVAGHTSHNRLSAFAFKPAPVQVTWLGYLATTGLDTMDYIIGDPWVTPPGESDHFVEEPLVLPNSYQCLSQPTGSPDVGPLPALENGFIILGSFNNFSKLNENVIALWARVLKAVDQSKLLLKNQVLTDELFCDRVFRQFRDHGIERDRLMLEPSHSREHILESYGRVDIALDPFPYTGCTTSFEALWMGVPVVTKEGNRFLSHAGESIMSNLEMPDWIATDEDDYIRIALEKASDVEALAQVRSNLRDRIIHSPLMDSDAFADQLHTALQQVWTRWLDEYTPLPEQAS